jgi:hypothetical protein
LLSVLEGFWAVIGWVIFPGEFRFGKVGGGRVSGVVWFDRVST